jgi:hypothetical protein
MAKKAKAKKAPKKVTPPKENAIMKAAGNKGKTPEQLEAETRAAYEVKRTEVGGAAGAEFE